MVAALYYAFSPYLLASFSIYPAHLEWALFPAVLLAIERSFLSKDSITALRRVVLASVMIAFTLIEVPQNVYLLGFVYFGLILFRILVPRDGESRRVFRLGVAGGIVLLTATLSIASALEFLYSRSYFPPYESQLIAVFHPAGVPNLTDTVFQAFALLNKESSGWLAAYNGLELGHVYLLFALFPAILTGFMFLRCLRGPNMKEAIFFAGVAVVSITLSTSSWLWPTLTAILPYFLVFEPTRFLVGASLSFAVLIGLGMGNLLGKTSSTDIFSAPHPTHLKYRRLAAVLVLVMTAIYLASPVLNTWSTFDGVSIPSDVATSQAYFSKRTGAAVLDVASPLGEGNFYSYGTRSFFNYPDIVARFGGKPYFPDLLAQLGYQYIVYAPSNFLLPYGGPSGFYDVLANSSRLQMQQLYKDGQDGCMQLEPGLFGNSGAPARIIEDGVLASATVTDANGGSELSFGGSFGPDGGLANMSIIVPGEPAENCVDIKGGVSAVNTTLSVQVKLLDGRTVQFTTKQLPVPEFVQQRINLPTSSKIVEISLILEATTGGEHASTITDANVYLFTIKNPQPIAHAAGGLFVVGGPDSYSYLGFPWLNESDYVPIFSSQAKMSISNAGDYQGILFDNTDPIDLAVSSLSEANIIQLWQHPGTWQVYQDFIGSPDAPSQVENTAFGQLVLSKFATYTSSYDPLRVNVRINQTGPYNIVLRIMGQSLSTTPFEISVGVNGNRIPIEVPQNRFISLNLGVFDLQTGITNITLSKSSQGILIADFVSVLPSSTWNDLLVRETSLLQGYNGSILMIYDANTYSSVSSQPTPFYSAQLLSDQGIQLANSQNKPGITTSYSTEAPKSGTYSIFVRADIEMGSNLTWRILDSSDLVVSSGKLVASAVGWTFPASEATFLTQGTYTLQLIASSSLITYDIIGVQLLGSQPRSSNSVNVEEQSSDQYMINATGNNYFVVLAQSYNSGWLANEGIANLPHDPAFFFLNAFYVQNASGTKIQVTYSQNGALALAGLSSDFGLVAVVIVSLDFVLRRPGLRRIWALVRNPRR